MPVSLVQLNRSSLQTFVKVCGPFFEHSPWIAERTWSRHPFSNLEALHQALCDTMHAATSDEKVKLILSHPDLVGRMARDGQLTAQSTREQAEAGLTHLSEEEIALFDRFNVAYRDRFGFPFVICARKNKKEAILAAFPVRLRNAVDQEIQSALAEIAKIARLRLHDAVTEE